ncbi:MAG TPA: helix-turn-helix domain-containing protein [Candidatus Dormibacteraeota bacterium]|jgi:transcriptional regulator with XRE-family HTH domain|nr:helix-turn-helix domain-containing protein [Candidatus Dormibacteraeota bacterium]
MIRISSDELRYQMGIRGWDQSVLAREAGVSMATVSRVMAGRVVRAVSALRIAQALRRSDPVPELVALVPPPRAA